MVARSGANVPSGEIFDMESFKTQPIKKKIFDAKEARLI